MRRAMLPIAVLALAAAGALLTACEDGETPGGGTAGAAELVRSDVDREPADIAAAQEASAAVEAFAADLYALLARDNAGENVVFSPYSAAVALAMTRAGAAGETASQMDAVLHADLVADFHAGFNAMEQALAERPGEYPQGDQTVELELATANQLWGQQGFEFHADFLDLLAARYGAGMRLVDYVGATEQARAAINDWVAEQTRDRIPELLAEGVLDDMTRLVLTNAIYLNAPWQFPFDEGATQPAPFHLLDGSEVEAQLMALSERLPYASGEGYQAVELPYAGDALSMLVVVPDEGAFESFEAGLDAARLAEVLGALEAGPEVRLRFPRFEFRTQAALKSALAELGMPVAFTEGADFSAMAPEGDDLLVQDVVHEAFISVDEEGTEAAAATAVVVGVTSAPMETVELTVDRPFLFFIRDRETGALLFMGRVLDPTA